MPTAEDVLHVARGQIGTTQTRDRSTLYGREYGMDKVAWCAIFQWWCFRRAGADGLIMQRTAYTPTLYDWYRKLGRASGAPQVGSLVFFDWPDSVRRVQHVGIVEVVEAGAIVTIEGNTSGGVAGSQDNGGMVARRRRARNSAIVGYGHPAYAAGGGARAELREGATGALVGAWQDFLRSTGARIDRVTPPRFGPQTVAATRAWQAAHGLVVDGVVGRNSWAAADRLGFRG